MTQVAEGVYFISGRDDMIPDLELWFHFAAAEPMEKGDERAVYGMDMFKKWFFSKLVEESLVNF